MDKPSIIFIVSHDLGKHLGCYGYSSVVSPNIDRLADESILFKDAYCTAPQCSPSRASIFTGLTPHETGVMGLTHGGFGWDFKPGINHIAETLKNSGYFTGLAGLQHERRNAESIGFEWGQSAEIPSDEVAQRVEDFLVQAKSDSRPYYLQVGFFEPHRPFNFGGAEPECSKGVGIPEYLVDDDRARSEFAAYQGLIRQLDDGVGKILSSLEKHGDPENTIVIFTTDHGIPFPRAKCSLYDPGIEVSLMMRWPVAGWHGSYKGMVTHMDIVPTLLDLLDIENDPSCYRGESLVNTDRSFKEEIHEETFSEMTYHVYYDPIRAIRTKKYKLIACFSSAPSFMDPSQSWERNTITRVPKSPSFSQHSSLELYDLESDPLETKNLINESAYQAPKNELLKKLFLWMEKTDDPILDGPVPSPMHELTMVNLTSVVSSGNL